MLLNVKLNSMPCSHLFKKERITDRYGRGDPVYFAGNNRRNQIAQGKQEKNNKALRVSSAPLNVIICSTLIVSIDTKEKRIFFCLL